VTLDWRKQGLVFSPPGAPEWMRSHASLPLGLRLSDGRHRVYFASRDDRNRSHVSWVELDLDRPSENVVVADQPALAPGGLGCFDDHGVYPASLVEADGRLLLYYIGWNPGPRQPLFYATIGLAASDDGGRTFERVSRAPVMARSDHDPCLVTSPCVRREGSRWRMWYVSGYAWDEVDGQARSHYHIKYAESGDGVDWRRDGQVCIDLQAGERNIARPWVLEEGGRYLMWYAAAGDHPYRLGYAESRDGLDWERRDDRVGIGLSDSGWDSRAMAYPWVERDGDRYLLLYNGNDYGRQGFGLAVASA
jgi:predicted GH43/DUF377 family glycosyl hydrolase